MALAACTVIYPAIGQEDMKPSWQANPDHGINYIGTDEEGGKFVYVASDKTMTLYDAGNGTQRWSKKFSEMAPGLRKIDEVVPMWDAELIMLFDRKLGKDQMAVIDATNGNALWTTDKFQNVENESVVYIHEKGAFAVATKSMLSFIEAKTGKVLWETPKFHGSVGTYIYNAADGYITMLNYKPTNLAALFSGFKNQLVKINTADGSIAWDVTYRGTFEKKILTREALADLKLDGDKVVLTMNGLQVYNYATGAQVYNCAFDQTPEVVKKPMGVDRFGAYGTVAEPIADGNDLYVLDMANKKNQYIKKYNRTDGKLVWTSPEIANARAIPGMWLVDGVIVLQVGGTVEKQWIDRKRRADGSTVTEYVVDFDESSPYNMQAFDAATGKQLWESERFKKGITNAIVDGKDLVVCSGKALYRLDIKTGKETYEVPLGKDNIGQASYIAAYEGSRVVVVGEKGVSTHNITDGAIIASSKYRKSTPMFRHGKAVMGNSLAMKTTKGDYAVYDLQTCKYKSYDGRSDATATMTYSGKYLFVYEDGTTLRKSKVTCLTAMP